MLDNELQAVNQQVNSHSVVTHTNNPLPEASNNKYANMAHKCCKTPLLYVTLVPFLVLIIIMLIRPEFIYTTDSETGKQYININTLALTVLGLTIAIDVFIYFYLIKKCNYKI